MGAPNFEIKADKGLMRLFINGKPQLYADAIFEGRAYAKGKKAAVLYASGDNICAVFIGIGTAERTMVILEPKPKDGHMARLLGKFGDREMRVAYCADNGKYYILFSDSLAIRGPIEPEAFNAILDEHGEI